MMDRLLTIIVVVAIHLVAVIAAAVCYGPACDWMSGGGWLSPAIRVPLVGFGVLLLELVVLAAVWPCNRLTHRMWGRHC